MPFSFLRRYFYDLKRQIFIVILLSGSLIPLFSSSAVAPFSDNFNSCPDGVISGCNQWSGNSIVNSKNCLEGKCIDISGAYTHRSGNPLYVGEWTWYIYATSTSLYGLVIRVASQCLEHNKFVVANYTTATNLHVYNSDFGSGKLIKSNFPLNEWFSITCAWNTGVVHCKYNDDNWSDNVSFDIWQGGTTCWNFERTAGSFVGKVDFIGETRYTPPSPGYSVIWEPTYPIDCQFTTTTSPISFNATGKITIPTENEFYWNKLYIFAYDLYNAIAYTASTTFTPALKAGNSENYSIPVSLPDGAFQISYSLDGYHPSEMYSIIDTHYCLATGIGTQIYTPALAIPEFPGYEPENCSEYPLLEKLVCGIQNFIKSLVYPSSSKINELKTNISTFQTKIPLNYLSASKNFFVNIQNGLATTTPSISLWGSATTSINLDFLTASNQIAGQNFTLKDVFKFLSSIILILILIFWSIDFKNRIFK